MCENRNKCNRFDVLVRLRRNTPDGINKVSLLIPGRLGKHKQIQVWLHVFAARLVAWMRRRAEGAAAETNVLVVFGVDIDGIVPVRPRHFLAPQKPVWKTNERKGQSEIGGLTRKPHDIPPNI